MKNILFVCTGNTCRSSMAEAMLKDMLKIKGDNLEVNIYSRGVSALDGIKASRESIVVMKEKGIDLTKHRSKLITKEDVENADLILTMTLDHKYIILDFYPEVEDKTYTLKEFAHRDVDIDSILDEINDLYAKIEEKRSRLIEENSELINKLQDKREELLQELEDVDREIIKLEKSIESTLKEEKDKIEELQRKIPSLDIKDPYGQPVEVYRKSAKEIEDSLRKIISEINRR